jgi:hypothetical protein
VTPTCPGRAPARVKGTTRAVSGPRGPVAPVFKLCFAVQSRSQASLTRAPPAQPHAAGRRRSPVLLSLWLSAVCPPACIHVAALDLVRTRLAIGVVPPTSFDAARVGGEVAAMTAGALIAGMTP